MPISGFKEWIAIIEEELSKEVLGTWVTIASRYGYPYVIEGNRARLEDKEAEFLAKLHYYGSSTLAIPADRWFDKAFRDLIKETKRMSFRDAERRINERYKEVIDDDTM